MKIDCVIWKLWYDIIIASRVNHTILTENTTQKNKDTFLLGIRIDDSWGTQNCLIVYNDMVHVPLHILCWSAF